jgi:hypothetical protein
MPGATTPKPSGVTQCPQCNTAMTPGAVICVNCGLNVATGERMGGLWEQRRSFNWSAVVGPIVALALLGGAYWGMKTYLWKPQAGTSKAEKKRRKPKGIRSVAAERERAIKQNEPAPSATKSRGNEGQKAPAKRQTPEAAEEPQGPQLPTFGGNRARFTCSIPDGWRPSGSRYLLAPASLKRTKVVIEWSPYRSAETFRQKTLMALQANAIRNFQSGELESFSHPVGAAKRFTVSYGEGVGRFKRTYGLLLIKNRMLKLELSGPAGVWDQAQKDFKTILDSVKTPK